MIGWLLTPFTLHNNSSNTEIVKVWSCCPNYQEDVSDQYKSLFELDETKWWSCSEWMKKKVMLMCSATEAGNTNTTSYSLERLHRFVQTSCDSWRHCSVRRKVQQIQGCPFHLTPCCWKAWHCSQGTLRICWLAFISKVWSCLRCFQSGYCVSGIVLCSTGVYWRSVLWCSDPTAVFEGIEMTEAVRSELVNNIKRRMTPQPVKIRARKLNEREKGDV